ncbi:MFS transporter [Streptomonospora nanhaiensis]|uniref:MFS transporter n=1 Tax=Streptomonospora nanhaiensis TaxID=1323731 RepID=UPI001C3807E8|nr:MFS transporter [Streptomonospora nanhaiensis]MBV2362625.1 MHS family MFS transporter [Streptomonospora nanhaiensis]MBX9387261.1 MHS family MFS transporter [Streptomonospora nanhaiensis]
MSAPGSPVPPTTEPPAPRGSFAKVVVSSLIGTTVEWYDFFLYGSAAALVFGAVFFPESDPLTGILLAFGTYAIGFVARPLGGLVFGHYGDRVGRKRLLVISLLLMGASTFAIGLLPGHATIGVAAPLLLIALRLVQGFALGGEWGGAVLLVSEHGHPRWRGFWASWPQAGVPCGNLLATAVLAVLAATMADSAFEAWGWRIPFLLSGVLVLIGLYVRLAVEESPVFQAAARRAEDARARAGVTERAPIVDVLRRHWREVLVAMGVRLAENISYYVITAFILVYAVEEAGVERGTVLNALLVASAVQLVVVPIWGALSDRLGRRPVIAFGAVSTGLWAFAFFPIIDGGGFGMVLAAAGVGLVLHAAMYGPQAAFFSELFGTRTRYSGASIGYQLASIAAGGLAPLIATWLLSRFGSGLPVSVYVAGACVLTLVAVLASRETRGRDLDDAVAPEAGVR